MRRANLQSRICLWVTTHFECGMNVVAGLSVSSKSLWLKATVKFLLWLLMWISLKNKWLPAVQHDIVWFRRDQKWPSMLCFARRLFCALRLLLPHLVWKVSSPANFGFVAGLTGRRGRFYRRVGCFTFLAENDFRICAKIDSRFVSSVGLR